MTEGEIRFMQPFEVGEREVQPGSVLLLEGNGSPHLHTTLCGFGVRYKTLANGRRQIIGLVFPGDLLGLQAGLTGTMKHSIEAWTQMTLCVFERDRLAGVFREQLDRARDLA